MAATSETGHNRMKRNITNQILNIVHWATFFFLLLTVGVFWGYWFALTRSYHLLSLSELIHVGQIGVNNLAVPMRIIGITTLLLMSVSAYLQPDKKTKWFYFKLASIACLIIPLVLTVVFEVPINNQVISWTTETAPENWETMRNQWQHTNLFRVVFALLSFGLFTASVVKPFHKEFRSL